MLQLELQMGVRHEPVCKLLNCCSLAEVHSLGCRVKHRCLGRLATLETPCFVQIANSDMERFWRLVNTDVRETLQPRLPELRPSACEAMISGLQKL